MKCIVSKEQALDIDAAIVIKDWTAYKRIRFIYYNKETDCTQNELTWLS